MRIRTVDQVEEAPYSPEILQCASASQKRARLFVATEWTLSLKGDNTTQQKKKKYRKLVNEVCRTGSVDNNVQVLPSQKYLLNKYMIETHK